MLSLLLLSAGHPSLIPLPNRLEWRGIDVPVDGNVRVNFHGPSDRMLARELHTALGPRSPIVTSIVTTIDVWTRPEIPSEGYVLDVDNYHVTLSAASHAGLFFGIQTLKQLNRDGKLAACHIEDAPRFAWRGLMLDVSRHFYGPDYVRKFIDRMAAYKLNTFHWHLTDDGGWRMEVKRYPKLTSVGAWRKEQPVEWDYGNLWFPGPGKGQKFYGGFYRQNELRQMVRYARERNVNIVPEIEMPGHSLAATASYPELQCEPPAGVKEAYLKRANSQAPTMICPGKDSTLEFYRNVLDEVMAVFPSKFIHIGGDEVDKTLWHQCRFCQARMKTLGLKNEEELQSWFVRQMDAYVASKGRRLIGWDEILEGGLAPGAAVMSWRGIDGGIAAARAGHDVVMSPTSHCYFDYGYDGISTERVYGFEPVPNVLQGDERSRVIGGQGNIWTEWLSSTAEIEDHAYPRALALAETLWTQPERKSWTDFSTRLNDHYVRLDRMGIAFHLYSPRLVPDILNTRVAHSWSIPPSNIPGARLMRSDGKPFDPRDPIAGDVRLYYLLPSGRRSELAVGRALELKTTEHLSQAGLLRYRMPWTKGTAPEPAEFRSVTPETVDDLRIVPDMDDYALLFEGGLVVPAAGRYQLSLGSDDGSVLYLDGQRVVDNDGLHAYSERRVSVDLEAGVYPMRLVFFNGREAQRLALTLRREGTVGNESIGFRH